MQDNEVVSRTPIAAVGVAPHGVDPDGPDEEQFRIVTVRVDYADEQFSATVPTVLLMPPAGWVEDDGSVSIPADMAIDVAAAIRDAASTARQAVGHW